MSHEISMFNIFLKPCFIQGLLYEKLSGAAITKDNILTTGSQPACSMGGRGFGFTGCSRKGQALLELVTNTHIVVLYLHDMTYVWLHIMKLPL